MKPLPRSSALPGRRTSSTSYSTWWLYLRESTGWGEGWLQIGDAGTDYSQVPGTRVRMPQVGGEETRITTVQISCNSPVQKPHMHKHTVRRQRA